MAKQTFTTGQVLTAAQMTSLQQTAMLGGEASAKTASYTLVAADAGTAISMSNASATTITVNTALFAAGDTVQITNLGAGVCTITAGTATVNTSASLALAQYESGTLDFTSTSAAIFIKGAGAAGASGDVWTLLNTTTLPLGNNTVTVTGLTSEKILVTITNATHAGGGSGFYYVTPTCGTTTGSEWRGLKRTATATMIENTQTANVPIANSTTGGTDTVSGYVLYTGCKSTSGEKSVQSTGGSNSDSASTGSYTGGGIVFATAALTEITFANTVNNFTAGTMKIYGA